MSKRKEKGKRKNARSFPTKHHARQSALYALETWEIDGLEIGGGKGVAAKGRTLPAEEGPRMYVTRVPQEGIATLHRQGRRRTFKKSVMLQ